MTSAANGVRPREAVLCPAYIHLVWVPIGALAVSEALLGILGPAPFFPGSYATLSSWKEAAARLQLLGLMLLFFIGAAGIIFKFAHDALTLFSPKARCYTAAIYLLCVLAGGLVVLAAYGEIIPRSMDFVGEKLFEDALATAASLRERNPWNRSTFDLILVVTNLAASLAVPAFVAGGISCLARFDNLSGAESWLFQVERLKNYIYMSSVFLVVGVLYLKAWIQYPGIILDQKYLPMFNQVTNSYAVYTGIEYTLILAAYALPVALILSRQANEIAEDISTSDSNSASKSLTYSDVVNAREKEKLTFGAGDTVKALLAVLSPLITGTVSTLVSLTG